MQFTDIKNTLGVHYINLSGKLQLLLVVIESAKKDQIASIPYIHGQRQERITQILVQCLKNLKKAFVRQAKYYNLKRKDNQFKIGDPIWKRLHILSSANEGIAAKLSPKCTGQFIINYPIVVQIY